MKLEEIKLHDLQTCSIEGNSVDAFTLRLLQEHPEILLQVNVNVYKPLLSQFHLSIAKNLPGSALMFYREDGTCKYWELPSSTFGTPYNKEDYVLDDQDKALKDFFGF